MGDGVNKIRIPDQKDVRATVFPPAEGDRIVSAPPTDDRPLMDLLRAAQQLIKAYDQPDTAARRRNLAYWIQAVREEVDAAKR